VAINDGLSNGHVRDDFLLDPSVVYLNHGSYGACPRPVFDAYQRYQRELERVNRVAAEERDRMRAETTKLEAEILGEARQAAARIIEDGRRQIAAEKTRVQFEVGRESERIANELAERVLGRGVN